MTWQPGARLVRHARREGAKLCFEAGGGVLLDLPNQFPEDLLADLKRNKADVAAALKEEAEVEAALRIWLPHVGMPVCDKATGQMGQLWGATMNGLIVDFGAGAPLLTMAPGEIESVHS